MCKSREEIVASLVRVNNIDVDHIKFKDGKIYVMMKNPRKPLKVKSLVNDAYRVLDGEGVSVSDIKIMDTDTGREVSD